MSSFLPSFLPSFLSSRSKARLEGPPHEIMQVSDIAAKTHRYVDKTSRCSDALNPHYFINGMEYKDESYTRPRPNRALIADNTILRTDDIPGAYVGWLAEKQPRRDFRNTNFLGDIKGAQADSIRPGIVTKREVNPLVPVYQSLDPGELVQPLNRPLVPAELVKVPTLPSKNKTSDPSAIGAGTHSLFLSHTHHLVRSCFLPSLPQRGSMDWMFHRQGTLTRTRTVRAMRPAAADRIPQVPTPRHLNGVVLTSA